MRLLAANEVGGGKGILPLPCFASNLCAGKEEQNWITFTPLFLPFFYIIYYFSFFGKPHDSCCWITFLFFIFYLDGVCALVVMEKVKCLMWEYMFHFMFQLDFWVFACFTR